MRTLINEASNFYKKLILFSLFLIPNLTTPIKLVRTVASILDRKVSKNLLLAIGISGYLILFLITLNHKQAPLFDEVLFIPNVYLFEEYGLSKEFLLKIDNQAPGPLYQFIHYPLKSITNMTTPGIRLVNVFILGLIILLISKIVSLIKNTSFKDAFIYSLNIVAVPMVWQVSGMALTEVPAMLFATLAVLFMAIVLKYEKGSLSKSLCMSLLGGIALGFAILGRSPFLLVAFAAGVLLLVDLKNINRWISVAVFSISALAMCIPVFAIWEGLVPPQQAFVGAGGIVPWHGILAFAYGALLIIIICPKWFFFNKKILIALILSYCIILVLNILVLGYKYYPLSEVLEKIFPREMMKIYPFLISPLLATLAFYFLACCAVHAWNKRTEPLFLFILACGILILSTSFKVTHLFSSRYVAQAAPFFVMISPGFDDFTVSKVLRLIIGMAIGFLSLETYFLFQ